MKNFKSQSCGFSTLELLIAMAVMTLSMTAVIMVAFGNQSIAIDTELAQRGLYLAQKRLEETGAALKNSFDSVSSELTASAFDDIYDTQVEITDISECVKRIDSQAFWNRDLRSLSNNLSMNVINTNVSAALMGDCATTEATDDWDNPDTLVSEGLSGQGGTAIDELDHVLYITANPGNANNEDEFFIFEFDEDDFSLTELGSIDLGKDGNGANAVKFGLNDVDVIPDFAFVASASTTGQLQVIDISNPASTTLKWSVALPGVDSDGSFPAAHSVYYYNDRVYVGTHETDGPEFHIFDVSGDLNITPPTFLGSLELNHNVHEIMVRDTFAYLATSDNNHELMVIDVSDPNDLEHPDDSGFGYNANGNHDGTSLFVTGDRVYLGRERDGNGNIDDFIIISRASVINGSSITDGKMGGVSDIGLANNSIIAGIRVSGSLAFLALNNPTFGLAIYNIQDPTNVFLPASCSEFNFSENTTGIDNDSSNQHMFISNSSNDDVRVVYDQEAICEE